MQCLIFRYYLEFFTIFHNFHVVPEARETSMGASQDEMDGSPTESGSLVRGHFEWALWFLCMPKFDKTTGIVTLSFLSLKEVVQQLYIYSSWDVGGCKIKKKGLWEVSYKHLTYFYSCVTLASYITSLHLFSLVKRRKSIIFRLLLTVTWVKNLAHKCHTLYVE